MVKSDEFEQFSGSRGQAAGRRSVGIYTENYAAIPQHVMRAVVAEQKTNSHRLLLVAIAQAKNSFYIEENDD